MIISFDPGGTTGVVLADNVNFKLREFDITGKALIKFADRAMIYEVLALRTSALKAVIIENFRLFPDKAAQQAYSTFEAVKVIERITVYCEQLGLDDRIVIQEPAMRKSASNYPDAHRRALGNNRHLYAAYQHLRYYVFMHKHTGGNNGA